MPDIVGKLEAAKEELKAQRIKSRAMARQYEIDLNQEAELMVDVVAREALAEGLSRSAIAKALGESRVTVNERLHRSTDKKVVKRSVEAPKVEAEKEFPPYRIDGDILVVDYFEYGPDKVSGHGQFEIVKDEDGEEVSYWFISTQTAMASVSDLLDTRYEGWYYEDAQAYVKKELGDG